MNEVREKQFDSEIIEQTDSSLVQSTKVHERDIGLDSLKAILIILVVFGHGIEYFGLDNSIFTKIKGVIYVFHMPLFIFISGYFSKKIENAENKAIRDILIPFFIFNTIYIILERYTKVDEKILGYINIFKPVAAYWYLLSLFIWKILLKYVVKFRLSIVVIFLLSLYIGLEKEATRFLAFGRTIAFFPYFLIGYYTTKKHIQNIRKINKIVTIPILFILIGAIYILSNNIINVELFKNAVCYKYVGVENFKGMIIRIFQFCIAILISICLINLIPQKKSILSSIGQKTITVYLLSSFIQKILCVFIEKNNINLTDNNIIFMTFCSVSTILIVWICSFDKVYEIYNKVIDWIYRNVTIKQK